MVLLVLRTYGLRSRASPFAVRHGEAGRLTIFPLLGLPLAIVSLVLLAGGLVMLFLIILAGARNASPLNQIWFLEADTHAIPGAPALSHWTLYNACPVDGDGLNNCGPASAAYPFQPQTNFGSDKNVPTPFIKYVNTRTQYILEEEDNRLTEVHQRP